MILLFTIGACSGRQGIRTLTPSRAHSLAPRPGQPYPATFRSSGPTGSRTRISATPGRRRPLGPWALRPQTPPSGPPGSRTPISGVRCRCRPVGPAARLKRGTGRKRRPIPPMEGPPENRTRSPSLPRRCAAGTPADRLRGSRPGRTRTCAILLVRQASSPLDDGTIQKVAEVGVEPTGTSLSDWRLCQFAYPAIT
jgi:hypothetical protein